MALHTAQEHPTFADLAFSDAWGRNQAIKFFPNGYGVSVIIGPHTYGGDEGLYELAVIIGNLTKFRICYDTPVADDVIGHLTPNGVTDIMAIVAALPARVEAA